MASQVRYYSIPNFRFQDGTALPVARIAYLYINSSASKLALIPTCFKGTFHTTLNFCTGALRDHRIIVAAQFGNGESSSPSNTTTSSSPTTDNNNNDNNDNASPFPAKIDYRDSVAAQHALLTQHLGITTPIDVVLGFSLAGQCTYYWAATHPSLVQRAVVICSSARTSGHNRQFLEGPAAALENAIDFAGRKQVAPAGLARGRLECPRGVRAFAKAYSAWLTSAEWYDLEKWRELRYESLAAYDEDATGPRYKGSFPDDLLAMLRAWQGGDVRSAKARLPLEDVLGRIETPILLMPCRTDQYFRWEASEREAAMLKNAGLEVIPSVWGHVAGGGMDPEAKAWMDGKIAKFVEES
ncbi:Alpha/Beta hydrolase protein [Microdochium trichocladiopsis]|uniref:Alpha/Beta hydrolase protein n=1 Tax=Microdochium trichocladiopsis TaxID=1682393 RepID=A0A9P8XWW9_9PEZI|nr:Alpha/Beta hydrolase protein [Microdochium trichocladiopsis]KAH7024333.1 Alpha/Beta hydrolase protein [Microdochium trichocladiopsis]